MRGFIGLGKIPIVLKARVVYLHDLEIAELALAFFGGWEKWECPSLQIDQRSRRQSKRRMDNRGNGGHSSGLECVQLKEKMS